MFIPKDEPSILRKLKHIHSLLIDPAATEGEKANAQTLLTRPLETHHLTLDDIVRDYVVCLRCITLWMLSLDLSNPCLLEVNSV